MGHIYVYTLNLKRGLPYFPELLTHENNKRRGAYTKQYGIVLSYTKKESRECQLRFTVRSFSEQDVCATQHNSYRNKEKLCGEGRTMMSTTGYVSNEVNAVLESIRKVNTVA